MEVRGGRPWGPHTSLSRLYSPRVLSGPGPCPWILLPPPRGNRDYSPCKAICRTELGTTRGLVSQSSQTQPLLGGGRYSRERLAGRVIIPPFPPTVGDPPRMAPPPDLGARFGRILLPRVLLFSVMTTFYMTTFQTDHCVFFQVRPPEESPHQKCSPRRGEFDSSTPEVFGGLSVAVSEGRRQTSGICCVNTRNFI